MKKIVQLNPGKDGLKAANYHLILLLIITYKILERIQLDIKYMTPIEQARFRKHRECEVQVPTFLTLIGSGFQKELKTHEVFVDLIAAYNTVKKDSILYKFA